MKKAFSLIEVLIFVTILSLFLVTSVTIITVSMRQNTTRVHSLLAAHYNDQLLEWIRSEKEINWETFVLNAGDKTYCFNTESMAWATSVISKNDCGSTLGGLYRRYAIFKKNTNPSTQVEATLITEWNEGDNGYSSKLHSLFTIWE